MECIKLHSSGNKITTTTMYVLSQPLQCCDFIVYKMSDGPVLVWLHAEVMTCKYFIYALLALP